MHRSSRQVAEKPAGSVPDEMTCNSSWHTVAVPKSGNGCGMGNPHRTGHQGSIQEGAKGRLKVGGMPNQGGN